MTITRLIRERDRLERLATKLDVDFGSAVELSTSTRLSLEQAIRCLSRYDELPPDEARDLALDAVRKSEPVRFPMVNTRHAVAYVDPDGMQRVIHCVTLESAEQLARALARAGPDRIPTVHEPVPIDFQAVLNDLVEAMIGEDTTPQFIRDQVLNVVDDLIRRHKR